MNGLHGRRFGNRANPGDFDSFSRESVDIYRRTVDMIWEHYGLAIKELDARVLQSKMELAMNRDKHIAEAIAGLVKKD